MFGGAGRRARLRCSPRSVVRSSVRVLTTHAASCAGIKQNNARFGGVFAQAADEVKRTLQGRLLDQLITVQSCAHEQARLQPPAGAPSPWRFDPEAFEAFQDLNQFNLGVSAARIISWSYAVPEAQLATYEAASAAAAAAAANGSTALDPMLIERLSLRLQGTSNTSEPVLAPPATGGLPHLARWDVAPPDGRFLVQVDVMTTGADRLAALAQLFATRNVTATDLLPKVLLAADEYQPGVVLYAPGMVGPAGSRQVVGVCHIGFEWQTQFMHSLPAFVSSIAVVVTSPSGRQTTMTMQGDDVTPESGDTHDARFDAYGSTFTVLLGGNSWTIALYPTRALLEGYMDSTPATNAIIIVLVVSGFGLCFALYELYMRKRRNKLLHALAARLSEVIVLKAEVERASAHEKVVQQQALEDGIRQKDMFVSMVSHEVRCARRNGLRLPPLLHAPATTPRASHR